MTAIAQPSLPPAPRWVQALERIYQPLNRLCLALSCLCLITLAILGAVDVIGRFVGIAVYSLIEMSQALLATSIFLALPAVQSSFANIAIDLIDQRLTLKNQNRLKTLHYLIVAFTLAALAWFLWRAGIKSFNVGEISTGYWPFKLWPFKLGVAVGATVAALGAFVTAFNPNKVLKEQA